MIRELMAHGHRASPERDENRFQNYIKLRRPSPSQQVKLENESKPRLTQGKHFLGVLCKYEELKVGNSAIKLGAEQEGRPDWQYTRRQCL